MQPAVAAVGARTAIGKNAVETGFLLRTGMPAVGMAPLVDDAGEAITMAFDATLDPYATGEERAAALATPALEEALAPLGDAVRALRLRLLLCLDGVGTRAVVRGAPAPGALLAGRLHTRARELAPGITLEIAARGAAGAAFALPRALDDLAVGSLDAVLLGGVHTDYDPEAIAALGAAGRIFTPQNLDALIPGEAAAFALLARPDVARRMGVDAPARLVALGSAMERATPDNDASAFEAMGLTVAIRQATEDLDDEQKVGWALCDHTFELRRIHEWQAMQTRTRTRWGEPFVIDSPAQRIGHLGAAALPLAIVLAAEAWRRGYAPAPMAMAFAGSDAGERGALLLSGA